MNNAHIKSLGLIFLALLLMWTSGLVSNIFNPLFEIKLIANAYVQIIYDLSLLGVYSDPIFLVVSYVVPASLCLYSIYLSIQTFKSTKPDGRGWMSVLIVVLSFLALLFCWHLFLTVSLHSDNIFRPR